MKYRDLFKQTFDAVHASEDTVTEVMKMAKSNIPYKSNRRRRLYRTILIAATMAALLATAAFAANLFGVQTLLTGEKITDFSGAEYYVLSLTHPQTVPEGLDPDIARMIKNNQAAVALWEEYCQSRSPVSDIEVEWEAAAPAGTEKVSSVKASDLDERSVCAPALEQHPTAFALVIYQGANNEILESHPLTEEEWALYMEQVVEAFETYAQYSDIYCGEYDIRSPEDVDRLEEIAVKYGLSLLEENYTAQPSRNASESELADIMASIGCAGNIFRERPAIFGEICWYNEGSFEIKHCEVMLPSGQRAILNARKSMYSTLAGTGMRGHASVGGLSEQSCTAADGTELTVLAESTRAFVYVFLEDSFFAVEAWVNEDETMTQEDINYIADFFHYSLIGG